MVTRRGTFALFALAACGARSNLTDPPFDGTSATGQGGTRAAAGGSAGNAGRAGAPSGGAAGDCGFIECNTYPCPGPTLELDLGTDNEVQLDASGHVIEWRDLQHSQLAKQELPDERPSAVAASLNGRNVATFDGINDYLVLMDGFSDFTSGFTAFVVAQPEATVPIHTPRFFELSIANGGISDSILFLRGSEDGRDLVYQTYRNATPGPDVSAPGNVIDGEWHIFAVVAQGGPEQSLQRATLYRDGNEVASADVYVPRVTERNANTIARGFTREHTFFKGSIAQIQIYRGAMTETERLQTECALRAIFFP